MKSPASPLDVEQQLREVNEALLISSIRQHELTEEALRESSIRLQQLSRHLLAVQEEERRHIARELHDEFAQLLATIGLHVHAAKGVAAAPAQPHLDDCTALLQRAGEEMRRLAHNLRPMMLETLGLQVALRSLVDQYQQQAGITIEIVGHLNVVPDQVAIVCFRVVQEALTNVARHAKAEHVWIEISNTDTGLELVVRDDGVGFDVEKTVHQTAIVGALGLLGMKERVELVGGTLAVESSPSNGTRIRAVFP
jgi:signal transduction histidine kinase